MHVVVKKQKGKPGPSLHYRESRDKCGENKELDKFQRQQIKSRSRVHHLRQFSQLTTWGPCSCHPRHKPEWKNKRMRRSYKYLHKIPYGNFLANSDAISKQSRRKRTCAVSYPTAILRTRKIGTSLYPTCSTKKYPTPSALSLSPLYCFFYALLLPLWGKNGFSTGLLSARHYHIKFAEVALSKFRSTLAK